MNWCIQRHFKGKTININQVIINEKTNIHSTRQMHKRQTGLYNPEIQNFFIGANELYNLGRKRYIVETKNIMYRTQKTPWCSFR